MSQAELSKSGSKPYFQSGRSRTKRSWVWNQFFVLEEYMGSDPLYVGKKCGAPGGFKRNLDMDKLCGMQISSDS
ncbi:hypothetical protein E5288_WYG008089 [Bos mutus]|uniref:Uncharacterized protein n=1 Tax=Bos mutus TaxID=72004 RepID=A0A6B0RV53_9CETA|nr:hypothetical protein [Bos mutus]